MPGCVLCYSNVMSAAGTHSEPNSQLALTIANRHTHEGEDEGTARADVNSADRGSLYVPELLCVTE